MWIYSKVLCARFTNTFVSGALLFSASVAAAVGCINSFSFCTAFFNPPTPLHTPSRRKQQEQRELERNNMHENFFITQFYVKFLGSKVAEQWKKAVNAFSLYNASIVFSSRRRRRSSQLIPSNSGNNSSSFRTHSGFSTSCRWSTMIEIYWRLESSWWVWGS